MNTLDLLIIALLIFSVIAGYRLGFVARAFSWLGLFLGIISAIAIIPLLFSPNAPTTSNHVYYALALLIGLAFIGQTIGTIAGSVIRDRIPHDAVRTSDRIVGCIAGVLGLFFFAWLILPSLSNQSGELGALVRDSTIANQITRTLPEPPNALSVLEKYVARNDFPPIFEGLKPSEDIPEPPTNLGVSDAIIRDTRLSTVRVVAYACGNRVQEGSGFFISPTLIVTNAHVIAGGDRITVNLESGFRGSTYPVAFDPGRDLALLRVRNAQGIPLQLDEPMHKEEVAIFGHPGGQLRLRVAPGLVAQQITATGYDIYHQSRTTRDVLVLAAQLRQGDSGSAVVNDEGRVVGVAFGTAPDKTNVAYALAPSEVRDMLAKPLGNQVSTGACIED